MALTLAVVAFQVLIVLSLAIARLFSRKHLQVAAGLWTVFTLFAVFASWLMVLQLLTIWLGYQWLRPRASGDDEKERTTPSRTVSPQGGQDPIQAMAPLKATPSVDGRREQGSEATKGRGMLAGLERINEHVRQKVEVDRATSALVASLTAERQFVNAALEIARRRRTIAHKGPEYVKHYEQARAEIERLFDQSAPAPLPLLEQIAAPDFDISTEGQDQSTAELIEGRIAALRWERELYLGACLEEVRADPVLKKLFWQATLDQNQPHLAEAFVAFATVRAELECRNRNEAAQTSPSAFSER